LDVNADDRLAEEIVGALQNETTSDLRTWNITNASLKPTSHDYPPGKRSGGGKEAVKYWCHCL
jgi:hypothetical protein